MIIATSTLVVTKCCVCGTAFAIESTLQNNLKRHGDTFYCPNGHSQIYTVSLEEKYKKLDREFKAMREQKNWFKERAETASRSLSATKGVLTRTKNRIARGVCPCCNRQFTDLQRHIETKHPKYIEKLSDQP
jgi:hypothetical protein